MKSIKTFKEAKNELIRRSTDILVYTPVHMRAKIESWLDKSIVTEDDLTCVAVFLLELNDYIQHDTALAIAKDLHDLDPELTKKVADAIEHSRFGCDHNN